MGASRFEALWRQRDFLRLWGAHTVSMFGTQISRLAIPLVAVLTLDASAIEVGLLIAAETLPYPLFGLLAGVAADRAHRRRLLISMDLARAGLLGALPLCWWLDWLSLPLLLGIAFAAGTCAVFFDIAAQAYLPALVGRERLLEANSKFALSGAATRVAGPGGGGVLIELFSAPLAVGVDALSFLLSGVLIARIRTPEPASSGRTPGEHAMRREIGAGVVYVVRHPILRPIAACAATFNLAVGMFSAVFLLFATRDLELAPGMLGLILATSGIGVLVGARLAGRLDAGLGTGRAIIVSILFGALGSLTVAVAPAHFLLAAGALMAGRIVYGAATVVYDIIQVSLRQAITPDELLGRVNATIRVAIWGTLPLGSLAGGLLGEAVGLRPTLLAAALGMSAAVVWLLLSDVRQLRSYDEAARQTE